jgi:NADPH:quinone reductase-like Zn-dependent oxidoreductase
MKINNMKINNMKAIILTEYGSPDVLRLMEVEKPSTKDNEILIKVCASSVNFGDLIVRNFKAITPKKFHMPFLFWLIGRISFGWKKPRIKIPGSEFSGIIESTGKNVTLFKKGDPVFGYLGPRMGAYAEYLVMPENGILVLKPDNISFEEAAAIPYGGIMAFNLLKNNKIQPGQKILINGASGGIGPAILQIAKYFGANVTGVCGTLRMDFIRSLGADNVIDYSKEDFTQNDEKYDIIIDILGKAPFSKCKNSLKPYGKLIYVSFKMKQVFQMIRTSFGSGRKVICAILGEKPDDLKFIKKLIEEGKYKPIIDKCFPLEKTSEAHWYIEKGKKKGNVIITTMMN